MKKLNAKKKLTLQREAIRVLDEALVKVVGGEGPRVMAPPPTRTDFFGFCFITL